MGIGSGAGAAEDRGLWNLKVCAGMFWRGGLFRGGRGSPSSSDGASADALIVVFLVFLIVIVILSVDPALLESLDGSLDVRELGLHVPFLRGVKLAYFPEFAVQKRDKDGVSLCGRGEHMEEGRSLQVVAGVELLLELVDAPLKGVIRDIVVPPVCDGIEFES